jgi:hypothetical protein
VFANEEVMGKNDITMDTMRTRGPSEAYDEGWARIFRNKAPQAECAPREAQPDGWKLVPVEPTNAMLDEITLIESFTKTAMEIRYRAMLDAAPTPERADADTAGASERDALKQKGLDDHLRRLQQDGTKSEDRADAGKDAALTDEQLDAIWYALPVIRIHNEADRAGMNAQVALRRAFARAILAANKEPK